MIDDIWKHRETEAERRIRIEETKRLYEEQLDKGDRIFYWAIIVAAAVIIAAYAAIVGDV